MKVHILEEALSAFYEMQPEALNYGNSYRMWTTASPEVEVCRYLYSITEILKPSNILETGTWKGLSCAYFSAALQENGSGKITTIEYTQEFIDEALELWQKLGLSEWINVSKGLSYNFDPKGEMYDILFLDTEPQVRFRELELFYPNLKAGGLAFIHDLSRDMSQDTHNPDHPEVDPWPFDKFPESLKEKIRNGELVKFHFPTPRGLTGFYKVHSGDYRI